MPKDLSRNRHQPKSSAAKSRSQAPTSKSSPSPTSKPQTTQRTPKSSAKPASRPTLKSASKPSAKPASRPSPPRPPAPPAQPSKPTSTHPSVPTPERTPVEVRARPQPTRTNSAKPSAVDGMTFMQVASAACETMGPDCRGYIWSARPLLWLGSLSACGFAISALLEFLHIIWWAEGITTASQLLAWASYVLVLALLGLVFSALAAPRDDAFGVLRLLFSLVIIAGGFILGLLRGWIPPLDSIINLWVSSPRAFAWLPECIVGCGAVWTMCGFFGITVKLYFWPKYASDLEP